MCQGRLWVQFPYIPLDGMPWRDKTYGDGFATTLGPIPSLGSLLKYIKMRKIWQHANLSAGIFWKKPRNV